MWKAKRFIPSAKAIPRPMASRFQRTSKSESLRGTSGRSAVIVLCAAIAGLRSGDRVTRLAGNEVEDWEALRAAYESAGSGTVEFELLRLEDGAEEPTPLSVSVPGVGNLERLGVISATILVDQVSPGTPAEEVGLDYGISFSYQFKNL